MDETGEAKALVQRPPSDRAGTGLEVTDYAPTSADSKEAIRLDSDVAAAHYNRGTAYCHTEKYEEAIADLAEAIRLDPTFVHAYHNRAYAHVARKEYEVALADYCTAIRLNPHDAVAYNCLAWLWAVCPNDKLRNGVKAVEYAERACALTSWTNANHLGTLGAAWAETGNFDEALKWEKKAQEDFGYMLTNRHEARQRLRLYEQKRPFRQA
jgi:Tfp pilus assembly protein PilF